MTKTFQRISRQIWVGALCSLACTACVEGELAELGIYDHLNHGGKGRRDAGRDAEADAGADPRSDAQTDPRPEPNPPKPDAGDATTYPRSDASAPEDASVIPPTPTDAAVVAQPGSGGASTVPVAYDDPDLKCYKLTAFKQNDRSSPYTVSTNPDLYVAFDLKAPWSGKQYVRSFKSLTDNDAVLVQMLLFKQSAGGEERVTENALGAHPDGTLLYSFAGGGEDLYFDLDVGMEVDSSVLYQLEIHYNNLLGQPVPDASGFELCVTPHKPTHLAGLSWLGTDFVSGSSARGLCTPQSREPIQLIAAQPRMRSKGRHMEVEITRASGAKEMLHDEDFAVDYQRNYLLNHPLLPGDVLNTTCTYAGDATFGKGINDEICYFYAIYWPAGALSSMGIGTLIHGANSCMDN